RQDAAARQRRLGARLLPDVQERAPCVPQGMVEHGRLGQGRGALQLGNRLTDTGATRNSAPRAVFALAGRHVCRPATAALHQTPSARSSMSRTSRLLTVAFAFAALLLPAAAQANPQQTSIMMDDDLLVYRDDNTAARALAAMKKLGVDTV